MGFFLGLILIIGGVLHFAAPNLIRGLDRFSNEWEGVETKQGETYEIGRMMSGGGMILVGTLILTIM